MKLILFLLIIVNVGALLVRADDNNNNADLSNYDDLDSFLSDLPHKMPEILEQPTEGPTTTSDPPPPQCYRNNKPLVFPSNLFSNKSMHYPFQESGLQIFLGLKIPCDGHLTAWQFLSAHTVIWGLHFGIFRRTCFDVLQLVSDTYINGQTTGTVEEKWVAWKPANPIPVKRGDVIGIFYDKINTATKSVSVRSVTLPDNYKYAPKQFARSESLVYLADAQSLAKSHGCVRLAQGRLTRRIPALFILMTSEVRGRLVPSGSRVISTTTLAAMPVKTTPIPMSVDIAKNVRPDGLMPLNGGSDCNQLPKFDYSCDISLGVRYYYDRISRVCRQFLYCPSSAVASGFGFASQADCMLRCSSNPLQPSVQIAMPISREAGGGSGNTSAAQASSSNKPQRVITGGNSKIKPIKRSPLVGKKQQQSDVDNVQNDASEIDSPVESADDDEDVTTEEQGSKKRSLLTSSSTGRKRQLRRQYRRTTPNRRRSIFTTTTNDDDGGGDDNNSSPMTRNSRRRGSTKFFL